MSTIAKSLSERRRRRTFDPAFKAEVVAACQYPGVSVTAIAQEHGLNANLLRRWVTEHERYGYHGGDAVAAPSTAQDQLTPSAVLPPPFVPVSLAAAPPSSEAISLSMTCGSTTVQVIWPVSAAAHCTELLRGWLR